MESFIGMIIIFGGNFAPRSYALCNGQLLPISQNTALFSILGTTYGGDGRTTFGLPDLRGRAPIHPGTGPGLSNIRLGQRTGAESHTLNVGQLASHAHGGGGLTVSVSAATEPATTSAPSAGDYLAQVVKTDPGPVSTYIPGPQTNTVELGGVVASGNVTATGSNQAFAIRGPELAVNFCIALQGIYPSRN